MADLFDLLSPEDQAKTKAWAAKRRESKYKRDIPSELYVAAQLGYYYGWDALVDFRRGYHIGVNQNGKLVRLGFSFEEAVAFVEAAEKVHYRQMLDGSKANAATINSSNNKNYADRNADYINNIAEKVYSE